ncbi:hypothetical protein GCK72_016608 [Caenorhabditis remanei]|uniref:Sdz-33 F-box domain-containing protein n=1 Tax=Caenorhabditis remanei TaxID=31234 RepID=A0A6A5G5Q8_CAERE|nr:hypothetical protein GCK72_016608 [Caenorhabditis remanei]KAF1750062.1 hypothetical protein GCK72_016608 [Caenorhabditis remanei]
MANQQGPYEEKDVTVLRILELDNRQLFDNESRSSTSVSYIKTPGSSIESSDAEHAWKIKLAMCSYKLELFIRSWKYKLKRLEVHLRHESLNFNLTEENDSSRIVFRDIDRNPHLEPVTKMSQLCDRLEKNKYSTVYIRGFSRETMFDLYNLVMPLYAPATIRWVLDVNVLSRETLLKYLDKGLSENCTWIIIERGQLSIERLTELMNRIPLANRLGVTSWIPADFKHPNAFKYRAIWYKMAQWVTLDDLKSIRNVDSVELHWTSFNCKDMNEFLRYWVDCDEGMMKRLELKIRKEIDQNVLTDELLVLKVEEGNSQHYFLKKRNQNTGKIVLGHLEVKEFNWIVFSERNITTITTLDDSMRKFLLE